MSLDRSATHNSVGFILKEFPDKGLCVLTVDSKLPDRHKAPGGRNTFHLEETPAETLVRTIREKTGVEIIDSGESFYVDENLVPHRYYFLPKENRNLPDNFSEDRTVKGITCYWMPIRNFFENRSTGRKLLWSQCLAFRYLVTGILSKDPRFNKEYADLIRLFLDGEKPPNFFEKMLSAVKMFFKAR
jgi:hypothetical protein